MSLALCKALSALSFWKPPSLIRPFSSSLAQFTDAGRIDKTTQEPSTADKETKVRARQAAAQEAYLQRVRADPERLEKFSIADSISHKKLYQRMKMVPKDMSNS
jgi:hypothetical protein